MDELVKTGKTRTILISLSILLVSIHTIYFYRSARPELETKKLIQQIFRFLLTAGLLISIYKGKNWAKMVSLVLFTLATLGAAWGLFSIETESLILKTPFLVMIFVYAIAIIHFGFSRSFKAFFNYQNAANKELIDSETAEDF